MNKAICSAALLGRFSRCVRGVQNTCVSEAIIVQYPRIMRVVSLCIVQKKFNKYWCREGELNSRPHHYQ